MYTPTGLFLCRSLSLAPIFGSSPLFIKQKSRYLKWVSAFMAFLYKIDIVYLSEISRSARYEIIYLCKL